MVRLRKKSNKGITLIALVITIVVLLILATVTIATLTGENGILTKATEAKEKTEEASRREQAEIDALLDQITESTEGEYVKDKKVNAPKLVEGMTKIMFTDPSATAKGEVIRSGESGFNNENWYDYEKGNWANTITEDGSMWVWIPRFAYKITSDASRDGSGIAAGGGTIDVKFLIGTTDQYYDTDGTVKTAKRVTSANDTADTKNEYYVHPTFTNESNIGFVNGGWKKELTGIWVAKFEAGYASGNNSAKVKESSQKYSQTNGWIGAAERGESGDGDEPVARNWLDGMYGSKDTKIKYPTFQGITYSMNYINHNDAFNIAKALNEEGNIYGFNKVTTDSHLMKDSEWGAVAYLAQSQYGLKGTTNIAINNITLNSGGAKRTETKGQNGVDSVYAVTGLTTGGADTGTKLLTAADITKLNSTTGDTAVNEAYSWNQQSGEAASSTGTIYGIYDLSGGLWERTAAYVANGHSNLDYGNSVVKNRTEAQSTEYATAYTSAEESESDIDVASTKNYSNEVNARRFGDAIHETSTTGVGYTSWFKDSSRFVGLDTPFSLRGGRWSSGSVAGLFYFYYHEGNSTSYEGFRAVLVVS